MLHLEIDFYELDFTKPIFYARWHVHILAIFTEEFGSNLLKFETLEVQDLDDVTPLELHPSDTF
jgi:hypothetical protein